MILFPPTVAFLIACSTHAPHEGDSAPEQEPSPPQDGDRDGYLSDVDCNDGDPAVHPGAWDAYEADYDAGSDDDCNGTSSAFRTWITLGSSSWVRLFPDLDGDGRIDLAYQQFYNYDGYAYESEVRYAAGAMPFGEYMDADWTTAFDGIAFTTAGDVTGDGRIDVALYSKAVNCNEYGCPRISDDELFLCDGAAFSTSDGCGPQDAPQYSINLDSYYGSHTDGWPTFASLGDLDGDGVEDLAIGDAPALVFPATALMEPGYDVQAGAPWRISLPRADVPLQRERVKDHGDYGLTRRDIDGDGLDELFTPKRWYWGADLQQPGTFGDEQAVMLSRLDPDYADCARVGPAGDVNGDGR